jgi:hypothetical protein
MPAPAITDLRTTIATALVDNTKWQTFAYPPANILPNSVIVSWDSPALEMNNNQYNTIAPTANFRILMTVPMLDNQGNLSGLEEMIIGVFNLLAASSLKVSVTNVTQPAVLNLASGDLLTAEMSISILTSWS